MGSFRSFRFDMLDINHFILDSMGHKSFVYSNTYMVKISFTET